MRTTSVNHFILETLEKNHSHLTAQQVYERIRERLPAVNPSTVYRALERLVHAGMVSVSDMGTGATVYETVGGKLHHHLVCQKCGNIITIDDEVVHAFFHRIEDEDHFHVMTNHLVLFGTCKQCSESNQPT
jgi:Fur family transcriptional regulator, ferric uptake regulator